VYQAPPVVYAPAPVYGYYAYPRHGGWKRHHHRHDDDDD
jgi:hypothetical protein